MRRTERLFRIIQILRSAKAAVTGRDLADELEISLRTLYRDVAELIAQRVPIRGEAGTGYLLEKGYDLPPLMLTIDELEAALLGASWVAKRGDSSLARGARDLIAKLMAVVPDELRMVGLADALRPISFVETPADNIDMTNIRFAVRERRRAAIRYADAQGVASERIIWPIFVAYIESVRIVVAWCELRQDFRHFRTDRLLSIQPLEDRYPDPRNRLLAAWRAQHTS